MNPGAVLCPVCVIVRFPGVLYPSAENAYQHVMVYHIKVGMDITFDKPSDPGEVDFNLAKG